MFRAGSSIARLPSALAALSALAPAMAIVDVPAAGASPDACVGLNGVTGSNARAIGSSGVAVAAADGHSKVQAASVSDGVALASATNNATASSIGENGVGIALADSSSEGGGAGENGGVGIALAVDGGFAGADADSLVAVAAAAGPATASTTPEVAATCTGPGLALVVRSDGAFCVAPFGFVASG
ncbi:MAG: hypothetical protein M3046_05535 [Actinomycetota bacterium]|nr:hypothetical protein [Actinomycetota bacterium]